MRQSKHRSGGRSIAVSDVADISCSGGGGERLSEITDLLSEKQKKSEGPKLREKGGMVYLR